MKTKQITIAEPCHQDWEQMSGDEQRRFCAQCDKHVHNLSAMTKSQAQALLEREADLCVIYKYNDQEELVFEPELTRHQLQLQGARKLLAAAALAVPMLLAACDEPPAPQAQPTATSPITLEEERGAKLAAPSTLARDAAAQGASRAPAPPQAQPTDEVKPKLLERMGQATAQLAAPEDEHEHEQAKAVSCDGADKADQAPHPERQAPQERLQIEPLRKTMGKPMIKMGKIKAHTD